MKKNVFSGIFVAAILLLFMLTSCNSGTEYKYASGSDTIEMYGDGTFQLVRIDPAIGVFYKSLSFEKYNSSIIPCVDYIQETKEKVYFLGHENCRHGTDQGIIEVRYTIYAVLTLENNTMQYYAIPDDPSAGEIYIYRLGEMVENKDVVLLKSLSDFSDADQKVFRNIQTEENNQTLSNKDVVNSYGNGMFEVLRVKSSAFEYYETLYIEKYTDNLIRRIDATKETDDKVYFIGHENCALATAQGTISVEDTIYAVITLKDGTLQYCVISNQPDMERPDMYRLAEMHKNGDIVLLNDISEFSEEDQKVFYSMQGG